MSQGQPHTSSQISMLYKNRNNLVKKGIIRDLEFDDNIDDNVASD